MLYKNVLDLIGNTPIVKLNKLTTPSMADVYVKLEKYNPAGSIKDRAALGMIEAAEKNGLLNKDSIIVEPTSGNTGSTTCTNGSKCRSTTQQRNAIRYFKRYIN